MAQFSLESAKQLFDRRQDDFRCLHEEALFILRPALEEAGISVHTISHRVKKWPSLAKKIESRQEISDLFADIHDIVGLRIVCLFLSDVERVGQVIRNSFDVVSEDDKIEGQEIATFGYLSVHFDVRLKSTHSGPRYDPIKDLIFEIQVRTIAMDAWAAASHYLDYKTEADVPRDLRRDFYALSGLFYVADRHFEMFFRSRRAAQEKVAEELQSPSGMSEQEINFDTVEAYLRRRFPDRGGSDAASISAAISELTQAGYATIKQVDDAVDRGWEAFLAYERDRPPVLIGQQDAGGPRRFAGIGVIRVLMSIVDERYQREGASQRGLGPYRAMVRRQ